MALTDKRRKYLRNLYRKNLIVNRAKNAEKQKLWRKNNPEKAREGDRVKRERYAEQIRTYTKTKKITRDPIKTAARAILNNAVKLRKVIRPDSCERCEKKCKVQGHHHDYSKPLDVNWLCIKCHALEHFPLTDTQHALRGIIK